MTTQIIDKVEAREIDLEELGEMIGVPIKVRPWWGSRRGQKWLEPWFGRREREISPFYRHWGCSAGFYDYYTGTPPRVVGKVIVVYEGPCGKKWGGRCHKHRQEVRVISVGQGAMLVETHTGTEAQTRTRQYILGVDGRRPYVAEVWKCSTLKEAFEYLKPLNVQWAEAKGLEVKRQGDWFFIPIPKRPVERNIENPEGGEFRCRQALAMRGKALYAFPHPLSPTRHYAEEIMHSAYCVHVVRGIISSPDHEDLVLDGWHRAVRNRAIRRDEQGGRPALGVD